MSKISLPIVLVVEGNTDKAFLSSFIDCDFVMTNGSAISRETIEYLKELSKEKKIVVLTDPDFPGEQIRAKIAAEIPEAAHAFVRKEVSIKHHKVGVAESTKEEVLAALSSIVPGSIHEGTLTMTDLYDLGLMGQSDSGEKRKRIADAWHLGHVNAKSFLKRLNALGKTKEELEETLHG